MKTAIIKSKQGNGTWTSDKYGMFYKWEIEMENGDAGEASTKDELGAAYEEGKEIDYEYTEGKFPKIKRIATGGSQNASNNSKGSNGSFALSYAKDVAVALIGQGKVDAALPENIKKVAGEFKAWLDSN